MLSPRSDQEGVRSPGCVHLAAIVTRHLCEESKHKLRAIHTTVYASGVLYCQDRHWNSRFEKHFTQTFFLHWYSGGGVCVCTPRILKIMRDPQIPLRNVFNVHANQKPYEWILYGKLL